MPYPTGADVTQLQGRSAGGSPSSDRTAAGRPISQPTSAQDGPTTRTGGAAADRTAAARA